MGMYLNSKAPYDELFYYIRHNIEAVRDTLRFEGKLGEEPQYAGRVLAIGISYGKKTKKHCCKVEVLDHIKIRY